MAAQPPRAVSRSSAGSFLPTVYMASIISSSGMNWGIPASDISAAIRALETPAALRFWQGYSTRPPTGGGVAGNSFPDVRTGIRAQVQHLKAYASSEDLNQACVDNRFQYVARESAPYVEWLGIQENPYGGGWAAGRSYGYKLRSLLAELKGEEYTWPESTETVEK